MIDHIVKIYENKIKIYFMLFFTLTIPIYFCYKIYSKKISYSLFWLFLPISLCFLALFFYFFWKLYKRKPLFVINSEGIYHPQTSFIPWENISKIYSYKTYSYSKSYSKSGYNSITKCKIYWIGINLLEDKHKHIYKNLYFMQKINFHLSSVFNRPQINLPTTLLSSSSRTNLKKAIKYFHNLSLNNPTSNNSIN
jgi:hypothetical protein